MCCATVASRHPGRTGSNHPPDPHRTEPYPYPYPLGAHLHELVRARDRQRAAADLAQPADEVGDVVHQHVVVVLVVLVVLALVAAAEPRERAHLRGVRVVDVVGRAEQRLDRPTNRVVVDRGSSSR